jgi:hypothetical protein
LNAGTLTLRNCRIAGNAGGGGNEPMGNAGGSAGGDGGGIYNSGFLQMENSVLADNSSGTGMDGGAGGNGGGLFNTGGCQRLDLAAHFLHHFRQFLRHWQPVQFTRGRT